VIHFQLLLLLLEEGCQKKGRTDQYTFGFQRAEVIGGLVNSVFLISTAIFITTEAITRFLSISAISNPLEVIIVASVGLVINSISVCLLGTHGHGHSHSHGGKKEHKEHNHSHKSSDNHNHSHDHKNEQKHSNSNIKAVFLHAIGDALGSLCALASGLLIQFLTEDWRYYFDPSFSLIIVIVLLSSSIPLAFHCVKILLQSVPSNVSIEKITQELLAIDGVKRVHELHIWPLSEDKIIASMHVLLPDPSFYSKTIPLVKDLLHKYKIHSTTIQPEYISETTKADKNQTGSDNEENKHERVCLFECPEDHNEFVCCPEDALLTKRKLKSPKFTEETKI